MFFVMPPAQPVILSKTYQDTIKKYQYKNHLHFLQSMPSQ